VSSVSLVERLAEHKKIAGVPRSEIEWIAAHGLLHKFAPGEILPPKTSVEGLQLVLTGHLLIYMNRGAGRRKFMEWRAGDVTGLLPYSRLKESPGEVEIEEPTEVFTVDREHFDSMIRDCPNVTRILVHEMLDRARHFNAGYLHDEKLLSLGKMSAGLAHELNNPVSAITRNAKALSANLVEIEAASQKLGAAALTKSQLTALENVREMFKVQAGRNVRSPLEQEERENSIAAWLREHSARVTVAEALAETDVTIEMLDGLAETVTGPALDTTLEWVARHFSTRLLISEICEAATRVYNLVAAIRGFTQMDRAAVLEPVDIAQGLNNTVLVLGSKARMKSAGLTLRVDPNLPKVNGFGSELNQVWSNLIDNALDAVEEGGKVEVQASCDGKLVVVRVIDNGSGIPEDIRDRIFEPFFTTKPVGAGTGLGLDIVRRLIQRHNGTIDLDSRPGRTEFRIRLPIAGIH
jgi:signal transduction histidine kinase